MKRKVFICVALVLVSLTLPLFGGAKSDSTPASSGPPTLAGQTVTINVPHAVGASTDVLGRIFQPYFAKETGATVVIENLNGGGGNKAHSTTYRAKPDGLTLEITPFPSCILGELTKDGDFKSMEFTFISNITGNDYNAIYAPVNSPYKTINDLINAAKTKDLSCAGSGIGTNGHMALILLEKGAGVKFNYVPFDGGTQAALAVAGNHTDIGVSNIVALKELSDQGRINILAVIGDKRLTSFPEVPTAKEMGYPNAIMDPCVGLIGPPGMDQAMVDYIASIAKKVTANPEFIEQCNRTAATVVYLGPADFKVLVGNIFKQAELVAPDIRAMAQ